MNLYKIFSVVLFVTNTCAIEAAGPAPSPAVPTMEEFELSMAMPCIDDHASGAARGASASGRSMRCEMLRQAAAPVQSFDRVTFSRLVKAADTERLKAFLKKQPRALLRANIKWLMRALCVEFGNEAHDLLNLLERLSGHVAPDSLADDLAALSTAS